MDFWDLRVFEAVARLGGMNRAALELNTVQSNVTARIRLLEAELGTQLFERHSRGVTLTQAGLRLLPHAAQVRIVLENARRAVEDNGTPKGPLVIGSLETTAALRLSPVLSRYVAAYPEVDISLRTGTTAELIDQVLNRELEGAFVCGPIKHPDLETGFAFKEELVVLSAPAMTSLDLQSFGDTKLIVLRAGCSYRQRFETILARHGVVGLRYLEFGTLEAIVGCVGAGLGVSFLPNGVVGPVWDKSQVRAHHLADPECHVETLFIRRRDGFLSSTLSAFLNCARPTLAPAKAA